LPGYWRRRETSFGDAQADIGVVLPARESGERHGAFCAAMSPSVRVGCSDREFGIDDG
jgi:hypothetical protein